MRRFFFAFVLLLPTVGCAGGSPSDDLPDTRAILRQAGPAPWRGEGVLHVRTSDCECEEWLDLASGRTRKIVREPPGVRLVSLQDGRRILTWSEPLGRSASLSVLVDPHDPRLDHASDLLAFWHKLHRGAARVVASAEVGGRPVWVVESLEPPSDEAPPDLEVFADLDQQTFLPLRVRTESSRAGWMTTRGMVYEERKAAPRGWFSFSRRWTTRERRLQYEELAHAAPFPVYAPPRRSAELEFSPASSVTEERPVGGERIPPDDGLRIAILYTRGGPWSEPVAQLIESRAVIGRQRVGDVRLPIAGTTRRVYVTRRGEFSLVVGSTRIHGRAALPRGELLTLLRSLRRAH